MKYIDVSEWQGEIEWEAVRGHIDGAILRAGYGRGNIDKQFARNASECNRLGIPCGAYWFSYAYSVEMARAEAERLLEAVEPYRMELPLAFDFEYDSVKFAAAHGVTVGKDLASDIVTAFCETVEQSGYWCLNYANPDFLSRYFWDGIPARFGLWLASWPAAKVIDLSRPPRSDCQIWQWTSRGTVPGIAGSVDVNEAYVDFAAVIRGSGINRLGGAVGAQGDGASGSPRPTEETTSGPSGTPAPTGDGNGAALAWARQNGLCGEVSADSPVTWGELAAALWRIYGPEDEKTYSGLLTDE